MKTNLRMMAPKQGKFEKPFWVGLCSLLVAKVAQKAVGLGVLESVQLKLQVEWL
jgi:hypothetical protein